MKGSGLSPLDSSKLRVEVLYEALLVQHKYGHTNNTKHVSDMNNISNARYKRDRVMR